MRLLTPQAALGAIEGENSLAKLANEFGINANQIIQWRKKLLRELSSLFSDRLRKRDRDKEDSVSERYQQIGQLNKPVAYKGEAGLAQKHVAHAPLEKKRKVIDLEVEMIPLLQEM